VTSERQEYKNRFATERHAVKTIAWFYCQTDLLLRICFNIYNCKWLQRANTLHTVNIVIILLFYVVYFKRKRSGLIKVILMQYISYTTRCKTQKFQS